MTFKMERETVKNIALIGFMGTGKSAVSRFLKERCGYQEIDVDQRIVQMEGMPITEIFRIQGEEYFRDLESRVIAGIRGENLVIPCGGGAVLRKENVENLKKISRIVLLLATPKTVLGRVRHSSDRPLLKGKMDAGHIAELMEKRRALYEEAADLAVVTDGKTVGEVSREIVERAGL